jgi:trimethylamine--corrinoid protein Co-methyltransferase
MVAVEGCWEDIMRFFDVLSPEELKQIHEQALVVLSKVGCIIEHQEVLELLQSIGAAVDFAKKRVRFSEQTVERALASTPKKYLAAGRTPEASYEVCAGMEARLRCIGGALKWLSVVENESHPISLADSKKMLALADALPEVDLVGTPYATEFPSMTYDVHSLRQALNSTVKHIWSLTISSKNLYYQMKLLEAVCGGKERIKTHKRISGIVCIIDPMKFPHDEIERLKVYGDYRVPVKWTSSSMIGGNAPYTVAGTLVQNVAQFLASLVVTETIRPGTPVVYYITLQIMDMRKGFAVFASPELIFTRAAIAQIARHYHLPSSITGVTSTGSEKEQAILSRSLEIISCMMAGASEINLSGSLDGGAFFSPEFAVLDNECMAYLRNFKEGFPINRDSMDLEAISRGIETGEYLSDAHTLEYLRKEKHFASDLFDCRNHESWAETDSRSLLERAWEKASHIIKTHQVPPLEEKLAKELDSIVAAADNDLLA